MNAQAEHRVIAVATLPHQIRHAAREFQQLTGLTVVTTFGTAFPLGDPLGRLSPPVHPCCAKSLATLATKGPCEAEWKKHLRDVSTGQGCRIHTCPLGLRCAGVPIVLADELVGMAKLVCGPEVSKKRFRSLAHLLQVMIVQPCQELHIFLLKERVAALQNSVMQLQRVRRLPWPLGTNDDRHASRGPDNDGARSTQSLVSQVLDYVGDHYTDRNLSLVEVATALKKNEKYITHLFAQRVGTRMRVYITMLRVQRACMLLLQTNQTIEEIARESGFAGTPQFRKAFRRAIGVTATEYRQIFASEAQPRTETQPS